MLVFAPHPLQWRNLPTGLHHRVALSNFLASTPAKLSRHAPNHSACRVRGLPRPGQFGSCKPRLGRWARRRSSHLREGHSADLQGSLLPLPRRRGRVQGRPRSAVAAVAGRRRRIGPRHRPRQTCREPPLPTHRKRRNAAHRKEGLPRGAGASCRLDRRGRRHGPARARDDRIGPRDHARGTCVLVVPTAAAERGHSQLWLGRPGSHADRRVPRAPRCGRRRSPSRPRPRSPRC